MDLLYLIFFSLKKPNPVINSINLVLFSRILYLIFLFLAPGFLIQT